MNTVQIILAIIALVRELIKYLKEREEKGSIRLARIQSVRDGLRKARNDKDTSSLERAFNDLGLLSYDPTDKGS